MNLETERLLIRDFTMADLDGLWSIFQDPITMEHVRPYTRQETKDFLSTFCVERTPPGAYAVVQKGCGKIVGYLLCNQIDYPGLYELGWIFHRSIWRQGYAFEAASALIDHLFRTQKAHKVVAETEDTVRSLGLMEKLGMRREGVFSQHVLGADGQWRDLYWYGLLRDEYSK